MLVGIADYLADTITELTWNPTNEPYDTDEVGIYLFRIPYDVNKGLVLVTSGGEQSSPRLGYDAPVVQSRLRWDVDSGLASVVAGKIYRQLHGLHDVILSDGTKVIVSVCEQSGPVFLGFDANYRPQFSINTRFNIHNPSPHRQAPT